MGGTKDSHLAAFAAGDAEELAVPGGDPALPGSREAVWKCRSPIRCPSSHPALHGGHLHANTSHPGGRELQPQQPMVTLGVGLQPPGVLLSAPWHGFEVQTSWWCRYRIVLHDFTPEHRFHSPSLQPAPCSWLPGMCRAGTRGPWSGRTLAALGGEGSKERELQVNHQPQGHLRCH